MSLERLRSSRPGRSDPFRLRESGTLAASGALVLGVSAVGGFVINLDQASIPVANPTIGSDLGATLRDFQWVFNAFLLPLVVLLVVGGALGDRFGRVRLLAGGLGLFALGSLAAALAPSIDVLLVGRVAQGVGAALVIPSALGAIRAVFSGQALSSALGLWFAAVLAGVAVGPLLAGALLDSAGWREVFWLDFALGALGAALAIRAAPAVRELPSVLQLDVMGNVLVGAGLGGLVWGLVEAGTRGWTSPAVLAPMAVGAALLVVAVLRAVGAARDWLDLRRVSGGALIVIMSLFGLGGAYFFLALYLQRVLGFSPFETGAALLPQTVVAAVFAPITGRLLGRVPVRVVVTVGLLCELAAIAGFSRLDAASGYGEIWPFFVLMGLAIATVPIATTELVLSAAPPERGSLMSGLQMTAINLGTLLSIAALGSLVASAVVSRYLDALDRIGLARTSEVSSDEAADLAQAIAPVPDGASPATAELLQQAGLEAFSSAMSLAIVVGGACVLAAIALVVGEPLVSGLQRRTRGAVG